MKRAVLLPILLIAAWSVLHSQNPSSPIHFAHRPIPFHLESSESVERHAPETMAGGVAVFDYNNDGHLDIYFANGADLHTLKEGRREIFEPIV